LLLLHALERAGANCCELGVPFSDPIADGPVLQAAADRALAAGTTVDGIFATVRRFRAEGGQLPIALMSYCNPLGHRGWPEVCAEAAQAGVDALILPDLPVEEGAPIQAAAQAAGLCTIFFAAPTSSNERILRAVQASQGFLYVVGRTGVTGAGTTFDHRAQDFLTRVAGLAGDLPTAVGFGISSAADVRAATQHADLAIVGTALVRAIHAAGGEDAAAVAAAESFVRELVTGLGTPAAR
jgi:tryptophan synthase alpha chain